MINNLNLALQNQQNNLQVSKFYQITFLQSLDSSEKRSFELFRRNVCSCCSCCCGGTKGIKGKINNYLSLSIVILIFSIATIASSFNFCSEYKELKNLILLKIEEEKNLKLKISSLDTKVLWRDLKRNQNCILIINLIIICFFIAFEIIQKVYCNTIIEKEKKQGKVTRIMILLSYIFNFCFNILWIVDLIFCIFEIIIVSSNPLEFKKSSNDDYFDDLNSKYEKSEEQKYFDNIYEKCLIFGLINFYILFALDILIFILTFSNNLIFIYLDLNYEDNSIFENKDNNQNYYTTINAINSVNNFNRGKIEINPPINNNTTNKGDDIIKESSINVNDKKIDILIKINQNLYLKEITSKIYTFKQILLKNITNDYIYIYIKNDIIKNMLSITDWEYPKLDQMYIYLNNTYIYTLVAFLFLSPCILFHANDEPLYFEIKDQFKLEEFSNIRFINIYNYYGNFEKGVILSRFYLYLLSIIIIYLFMIKRAIYRNIFESYVTLISNILSRIFIILNVIYNILNIFLIVFSFLADSALTEYSKRYKEKFEIEIKTDNLSIIFILQACLNIFFFLDFLKLICISAALSKYISEIKNNPFISNENESSNGESLSEINYIGLDSNEYTLYEYQIEGHPRYLYYSFKKPSEKNNNLINISNKGENMNTINSINELINEPNKNNVEVMELKDKKHKRGIKN